MCQSIAEGGRRCVVARPGTRLALSISRRLVPEVDEKTREGLVRRLHREAAECGMESHDADPGALSAWLDYSRLMLTTIPMQETYRAYCLKRWTALASDCDRGNVPDAADLHVWRHLASTCEQEIGREERADPQTVAFDLDGCLYPFSVFNTWLVARGFERPTTPHVRYSAQDHWGISTETFFDEMRAALHAGLLFRQGDPYEDGLAAVRAVYRAGHNVTILTARNIPGVEDEAREATVTWLRQKGVPFHHLAITHKKHEVPFDLLVDDHPGNVATCRAAGRHAVLLDRPWTAEDDRSGGVATYSDVVATLTAPPREDTLFA